MNTYRLELIPSNSKFSKEYGNENKIRPITNRIKPNPPPM